MLNELMIVERGAREAHIRMPKRHPDVKDAGGKLTLIVEMDEKGNVENIQPIPTEIVPWTIRDGQHNSFPFVQPSYPLWVHQNKDIWRENIRGKKRGERRNVLLSLKERACFNTDLFQNWPGDTFIRRLKERGEQLKSLKNTDAALVPASIERFLLACERSSQELLDAITKKIIENLSQNAQYEWEDIAVGLLVGKKIKDEWKCDGALLFEATDFSSSIVDEKLIGPVSDALQVSTINNSTGCRSGICGLTGKKSQLLTGNFYQPILPAGLGQTYLFTKNREIPANDRYGRFADEAMPVGVEAAKRLDAALRALTKDERKNKTWRAIPGEVPKQNDLFLAFVDEALDAPTAAIIGGTDEEDFADEESHSGNKAVDSVAAYEKRTERLINAYKAKVQTNLSITPVHLIIIRKVDPANRKVVYSGAPTVSGLDNAAKNWITGERNLPSWLTLPVLQKDEKKPWAIRPPHVAPLGLIAFSRKIFIRGGIESREVIGLPAAEILRLFFSSVTDTNLPARRLVRRVLHMVLTRREMLISGTAHALHKGFDFVKKFDRNEALRTTTILGILLNKLDRQKEVYMNELAFKLGQLLAAADVVHAGYCADVRGGEVPPSLLGNQIFSMAQKVPAKALAMLCRRWKPYAGWAKKAAREKSRAEELIASKKKKESQRGWDIKIALRHAREMGPLAAELAPGLESCRVDDVFLAELLLGYIAGLPKTEADDDVQNQDKIEKQEV